MKKILFLYHTSTIGGGSYCLLNILKSVDRAQIEPVVLLCNDGPLVGEIKSLGIGVSFLPSMHVVPYNTSILKPTKVQNALSILWSMKQLKGIIATLKPDAVYCNTMMLYPYLRIAKKMGCKTYIHIREHWPEGEHRWQRKVALTHIAKYADEIIAINRYSASMVTPYGRKATIVYDWIDMTTRYQEMPLHGIFSEEMSDKKVFLFMGGMQKIKGTLEVLTAFSNYLKGDTYRLLALGVVDRTEETGIRKYVKSILSLFGRKDYSTEVGRILRADNRIKCIPGIYNIRHLYEQAFCVISYFTIPHANLALAESIICNTLNVAAMTDESMEYSLEGELAILYEENNFQDFVNKLHSIEECRNDYIFKMKAKSRIIEDIFNPSKNISVLNKILTEI